MLAVVKVPHTEGFRVEGAIPASMIRYVEEEYGKENVRIENDEGEEILNPFDMDWFKEVEAEETPGSNLRFYRNLCKMTQSELADKLGTTKQIVSMMEHDKRPISKKTAVMLSKLFRTSVASFIS